MQPFHLLNPAGREGLVLTCEHASCRVPVEYDDLGLEPDELADHIAWDIGAGDLTRALAARFDAPAVLAGVSRLVIDCNRDLADADLIVAESHGIRIPGNGDLDDTDRGARIRGFYDPYHEAIDATLSTRPAAWLVSLHSFTPRLQGRERRFDVGVLFDDHADDARRAGECLAEEGLIVRYNQPYSAFDGLIFSARTHGHRHGVRYVELEINNKLLRSAAGTGHVATAVGRALSRALGIP
jgi:predicted N-formylglutamate amidohydrolase